MKKIMVCLVVIFAMISFVGLTTVHAYPFIEVEGFVDPYVGTVVNNGATTTFSEVEYSFIVTSAAPGAEMNFLSLGFDVDVFAGFGSLSLIPVDWTYTLTTSPEGNTYTMTTAGTTIGVGEQLNIIISDLVVYNEALVPGNDLWQEGQIWAQSFLAGDTLGGGDGGSTTLVPEPGTLMLFGLGLTGLLYVRRTNIFNI